MKIEIFSVKWSQTNITLWKHFVGIKTFNWLLEYLKLQCVLLVWCTILAIWVEGWKQGSEIWSKVFYLKKIVIIILLKKSDRFKEYFVWNIWLEKNLLSDNLNTTWLFIIKSSWFNKHNICIHEHALFNLRQCKIPKEKPEV